MAATDLNITAISSRNRPGGCNDSGSLSMISPLAVLALGMVWVTTRATPTATLHATDTALALDLLSLSSIEERSIRRQQLVTQRQLLCT